MSTGVMSITRRFFHSAASPPGLSSKRFGIESEALCCLAPTAVTWPGIFFQGGAGSFGERLSAAGTALFRATTCWPPLPRVHQFSG